MEVLIKNSTKQNLDLKSRFLVQSTVFMANHEMRDQLAASGSKRFVAQSHRAKKKMRGSSYRASGE
ncbi:MAG TPA: hypothetical protein DHU55_12455 [Blastocatellia bacterium]|nr:hypothetical protein [Blastocatellia bacterium]HCX30560.1 hypothetical protein [Blastocatellia bacterium]